MITMKPGNYINEYYGLTTDTKPTDPYLPNASIFYEMDTGDIYLYDAANGEWVLQPSSDGGGGGTVETDKTLTRDGVPADAKAAGDRINVVKAALAPEFDEDEYYSANTYVWHDGTLYVIVNEHDSGVSWEDTDPFPVVIADELTAIWNSVNNPFIFDILMRAVATRFDETYDYAKDAIVWGPSGELYRLPNGHVSGESWNQTSALLVCVSDDYIRRINNIQYHIADYFSVLDYLPPQSFVWYEDSLYYLPYGHTSGALWENTNHVHASLANKIRENLASLNRMIASARENTNTASRNYAIGDYVISGDILYKVIAAITTGGTLRDGINVVQTDVMAEIAGNAGLASAIKAAIAPEFDANEYYPANTYVWHDGTLYVIFAEHDSGVSWEDTSTDTVDIGGEITYILDTLDRVAFSNAIAYEFEENVNYVKDALVWQNGGLYRLPYGHTAGVAWGNSMAVPTNLGNELETRLYFLKEYIAPIFDEGVAYSAQSCVWYYDRLYKLLSDHVAGTAWNTVQKTEVTVTDLIPDEVQIDTTLKRAGAAADAKATGDAIADVKSAISFFDDIPGTVQTVNFDANGNPSSIVHTANGEAVRTDSFTWGDNTVTEKRELADGSYITFVTDLTTLVTTISEIQEA